MFRAAAEQVSQDPWRFQLHVEVWVLIAFLFGAYAYAVKVIGPRLAPEGNIVTRRQVFYFVLAMLLLWGTTDWPVHDISEEYLYSVHMVQHMSLSYFVPPLALLATPEWLFRLLVGNARTYTVVRFFARPAIAGVLFNLVVMITHIPGIVNASASNGPLHYGVHVLVVTSALLMWLPVCGPAQELRMSVGGMMIYMFAMSLVPTVPAGWLTFAEGSVYDHYDIPVRVWGVSVLSDQQAAGGIMKLGGSVFMWFVIIYLFFKKFMGGFNDRQSYKPNSAPPDAEIIGTDDVLLYKDVEEAFSRVKAAPEPR